MARVIKALVFDLDGVLIDSEQVWDEVRESYAGENGGRWHADAQTDMMGMNSREWSRYMHDEIGLRQSPEEISQQVADRVADVYRLKLPLLPRAVETVQRLAERWELGVASSSNRPVIDLVLELAGLTTCFAVMVSAEEVRHGKPQPDVYREERPRGNWPSRPRAARPLKTRRTGSSQPRQPACSLLRSRIADIRRVQRHLVPRLWSSIP
jgi:beta-phosphoglucomutase-like phosphatase (HAD superfamily)